MSAAMKPCAALSRPAARAQLRPAQAASSSRSFVGTALPRVRSTGHATRKTTCMGLFGLGVPELVVIGGVAALIFGPSKLPELGKGLGKAVKSFQGAAKEFEKELKDAAASDDEPPKKPEEPKQ